MLPNIPDAKTAAVSMSDAQWEDVLIDRETEENQKVAQASGESAMAVDDEDDIYAYGDEAQGRKIGDWVGVDRDRRSAYIVIGALKSEGLI